MEIRKISNETGRCLIYNTDDEIVSISDDIDMTPHTTIHMIDVVDVIKSFDILDKQSIQKLMDRVI